MSYHKSRLSPRDELPEQSREYHVCAYINMKNIYWIPSLPSLHHWLLLHSMIFQLRMCTSNKKKPKWVTRQCLPYPRSWKRDALINNYQNKKRMCKQRIIFYFYFFLTRGIIYLFQQLKTSPTIKPKLKIGRQVIGTGKGRCYLPRKPDIVDNSQNILQAWNKYTHHCPKFNNIWLQRNDNQLIDGAIQLPKG